MFNRKKKKIEALQAEVDGLKLDQEIMLAANKELYEDIKKWDKANNLLHQRLELEQASLTCCEHERDKYKAQAKKTRVEVADEILKAEIHLQRIPDNSAVYGFQMRIPGWDIRNEEELIKELQWLVAYHVHKGKQGDPAVQPEKKTFTPRVARSIVGTATFDDTEHFAKEKG
jgi:hypothetical protein